MYSETGFGIEINAGPHLAESCIVFSLIFFYPGKTKESPPK